MAKKKNKAKQSKKTSKISVLNLVFLIALFTLSVYTVYYFVSVTKNYSKPASLKPLIEQKIKQEEEKSVSEKKIAKQDTSSIKKTAQKDLDRDSLRTDKPEIEIPEPVIRDKAKLYTINPNLPKICIIVDDFGAISSTLFERFNSLDKEIAFAVLPNLRNSKEQMKKAVEAGREVIIHIPMEPENPKEKLEPNTILTSMNDFEIKSQIESWMYELPLVVGANNHMGSKATVDERLMYTVLSTLKQNDLFFIDSYTTANSVVKKIAKDLNVKTLSRDIFLDVPETSLKNARTKIEHIKKINNKDVILVITHCHTDVKYRQLVHFIDRIKDEGYQIIPLSLGVR